MGGLALSEDLLIIADVAVRIYDIEGNLKATLAPVPKGDYRTLSIFISFQFYQNAK